MTNINLNTMPATAANNSLKTKTKRAFAMLSLLGLMATPKAFAQTIVTTRDIDGVRYTLWSDNTASVESTGPEGTSSLHTQFSGQLDFLQTISYNNADYTLTKIGSLAFSRNENITGISIPSTVTSIGAAAFRYCDGVTGTIALPDGLTTIDGDAFIGCGFTGTLTIPNSVTYVGANAFCYHQCSSVVIGDGLSEIPSCAFQGLSPIYDIELGRSVTSIGNMAFHGYSPSNTSYYVNIRCASSNPPTLGNDWINFDRIYLRKVYVPCGSLDAYQSAWGTNDYDFYEYLSSFNQKIDGVYYKLYCDLTAEVYNKDYTENYGTVSYSGDVVIPSTVSFGGDDYTVTKVAKHALSFCEGLNSVSIGENVQTIGQQAFFRCYDLPSVTCLNPVPPTCGDDVFAQTYVGTLYVPCGSVEAYAVASPWKKMNIQGISETINVQIEGVYYLIEGCNATTATVIYDASYAALEHVSIEDFEYEGVQYSVTAIAEGAFDGFDNLEGVDCHSNIGSIGANAFRNCTGITYFGFYHADTPPTLGEGVFDGLGIDTLWLSVPFCSQYDYSVHPVFGQFGEIFGDGDCEYTFINAVGDKQWTNPVNWAEGEVPNGTARVGIFNDCEIDTDLTVGSVTIGSTYSVEYDLYERLTVKDGATLTATNFIYTTGEAENFVIEDGAQVIHPNAGAKATVEKGISGYVGEKDNYYLIGYSFVDNGAVDEMDNLLENDYDLFYYDEPTHYWMNQKNAANNFMELEATKGYLYANSQAVTLGLKGTLNPANETVTVPLSYTDGIALAGFNLVGNPFAHNVTAFAGTNVADEVYRMNGDGSNVVVGEIAETDPLKPAEGFFVKATDDNASITFNSRAKAPERSLSLSKGRITIDLTQNGLIIDRLIVKNDGEPLEKFTLNENGTRIYATQDGQDYAVVVRGRDGVHTVSTNVNEIPVNFKAAKNGTYTLTVNVENTDLDYLHLIDNLTGSDVNLLPLCKGGRGDSNTQPSYTFTAKTTDYASRFRLVFVCGDADDDNDDDNDAPFAFVSNGEIVLIGDDASQASLQIVDATGRVIRCTDGVHTVSTNGMVPGVYVLRLINGNDVRTQKLIISE